MIVSLVFSVISITVSLSLSLPLSQLISCWMNTAMFVSPTSDSPATSQRRNPTPACKSLLNSLLTLSAGGGVISVLLTLVSGINPFWSTNVWQFPSVYTLCVCVCMYILFKPLPQWLLHHFLHPHFCLSDVVGILLSPGHTALQWSYRFSDWRNCCFTFPEFEEVKMFVNLIDHLDVKQNWPLYTWADVMWGELCVRLRCCRQ